MKNNWCFIILFFAFNTSMIGQLDIRNSEGTSVKFEELMDVAAKHDVVFFGEIHDDSIAHFMQLRILEGLHARRQKVVLSMEMFETDTQIILDEYLNGIISKKSFEKDARVWSNYQDYSPIVEFQKSKNGKVVAANAPSRYVRVVSKGGQKALSNLSKDAKSFLPPLPYFIASGRYAEKFNEIMGDHDSGMVNIYESQNLWDASMANSIHKAAKADKDAVILHLCGGFHCEEKLGTVAQLNRFNTKLRALVIVGAEKSTFDALTDKQKQALADYVIITKE
jgi:uncharacterized iron-regulated protein